MDHKESEHVLVTKASERIEAIAGVLIAIFASILALADLAGGRIEEEMKRAEMKHIETYNWYQSKSLKQSMQENHLDFINIMSRNTDGSQIKYLDSLKKEVLIDISRYKKEKKEILFGSANIKKEEWAQDMDGKLGVITGVKEWQAKSDKLSVSVAKFDISQLFFQICLVLGAVCIIIFDNPRLQNALLKIMIGFGLIGSCFAIYGYALS